MTVFWENRAINAFVFLRILIGSLFILSGFDKLAHPHVNFLYVIQSYDIVNDTLAEAAARVLPWVEFLTGIFLVLGLWLEIALSSVWFMTLVFILVVAQAIWRGLSLSDCGCFGDLFSFPLPAILLFDSSMLILITLLRRFGEKTSVASLDRYFLKQK